MLLRIIYSLLATVISYEVDVNMHENQRFDHDLKYSLVIATVQIEKIIGTKALTLTFMFNN